MELLTDTLKVKVYELHLLVNSTCTPREAVDPMTRHDSAKSRHTECIQYPECFVSIDAELIWRANFQGRHMPAVVRPGTSQ